MTKQKTVISWALVILGVFSLLLLFPILISGGPGQEQKGVFLLKLMAFGVGCVISGVILLIEKRKWRWVPLIFILVMTIKLGFRLAQGLLSPNGTQWFQRNSILPLILAFLIYSEYYLVRKDK